jgi:hypothetical protein
MSFPTTPLESDVTQLSFALLLRDGLSFGDELFGDVTVTAGSSVGARKGSSGEFLFFGLGAGPLMLSVRSGLDTPYYLPADVAVTLPMPSPGWPAFPDATLADPSLPLWDPNQPEAYRKQFLTACLKPSIAYPFAAGVTLVRGTVQKASTGKSLEGVTVSAPSDDAIPYVTGYDGQFVLALQKPPSLPAPIAIRAQRPGGPAVDNQVTVRRAATATLTIKLGI